MCFDPSGKLTVVFRLLERGFIMRTFRLKGFTLIELLVVIAIIAILAAILFPVFAQAREKARQTTCISNEKQIGLALLQYNQDNDETYPLSQYYVTGNPDPFDWANAVYAYVKNGDKTGTEVHNGKGGVWDCPSFPRPEVAEYGINLALCHPAYPGVSPASVSMAAIDSPAERVAVLEKGATANDNSSPNFEPGQWNWAGWLGGVVDGSAPELHMELAWDKDEPVSATPSYPNPGVMPRFRHHGRCSTLFCDGHVKAMGRGQISWAKNIYIPGAYDSIPTAAGGSYQAPY
jgi:prepilin-type N-terminal cleavage/methylation domain-containing protein/prepilin-type processing-associated H-X9-DG protein